MAKEYHAKKKAVKLFDAAIKKIPNQRNSSLLLGCLEGATAALSQLENQKKLFNDSLKKINFGIIETRIVKFQAEYHIAASSAFTIEKDLSNNLINDLSDVNTNLKYLYFTIFPQNGKTYVLISYLKKNKKKFSGLIKQLLNKSVNERKVILSNIIAIHIENFAFSPIRWAKISEHEQLAFQELFQKTLFMPGDSMSQTIKINLFI